MVKYSVKSTRNTLYVNSPFSTQQAVTENNSPQEAESVEPLLLKEQASLDDASAQEESPDQSISSAMPIDSGTGDGAPLAQDGTNFCLIFFKHCRRFLACFNKHDIAAWLCPYGVAAAK